MKTISKSKPLKRLAAINREVLPESTPEDYEIEYVDISNVTGMGRILGTEKMPFGRAPSRARRLVRSGDTIVSTVRTYLRAITTIQDPPPNLVVSTGFATLTPGLEIDGSYFAYLAQTEHFIHEVVSRSTGVSYPAITPTELGNIHISYPPLPLQRRIAAHLDRETARIDALVAEKEALLRLLEEKRASLISHAVTRGLNPKAKLKPSGMPWLGDVPEHWEVKELRHIAAKGTKITYGIVQAGPDVPDGIPYIRTSDMAGDFLPEEGYQKTTAEIDQSYARSRVYEGDMVISIRASVGKTLEVPAYLNGANLTQGTAKVSPGERIASRFLFHWMNCHPVQRYLNSISKGTTFKEITLEMLRRTPILVPPKDEQLLIVERCDRMSEVFRSLKTDIQTSIHLLREKRTSLISAAVTGEMAVS